MGKRTREEDDFEDVLPASKRMRPSSVDRLSKLSDELILKAFDYLPASQLVVCQRYVFISFRRLYQEQRTELSDSHTNTTSSLEMASYGNLSTTTALSGHERVVYLA